MASLPVPASIFFADFAFDLKIFNLGGSVSNSPQLQGLPNKDEDGRYIAFLHPADIQVGDVLTSLTGEIYTAKRIDFDHYNGVPEMIKVYY